MNARFGAWVFHRPDPQRCGGTPVGPGTAGDRCTGFAGRHDDPRRQTASPSAGKARWVLTGAQRFPSLAAERRTVKGRVKHAADRDRRRWLRGAEHLQRRTLDVRARPIRTWKPLIRSIPLPSARRLVLP